MEIEKHVLVLFETDGSTPDVARDCAAALRAKGYHVRCHNVNYTTYPISEKWYGVCLFVDDRDLRSWRTKYPTLAEQMSKYISSVVQVKPFSEWKVSSRQRRFNIGLTRLDYILYYRDNFLTGTQYTFP